MEDSIAAAARTGGRFLTCVTGMGPRQGDPAEDAARHAAELQGMIENLRRLADRAAEGGCILCVEPVAAAWIPGLLVATLGDALQVVRAVAHPAVKILFDIAHVQTSEGDVLPRLRACWSDVALLQAADTPGRRDLGSGELDWPAVLRFVRERAYAGLIEIEHLPAEDSAEAEHQLLRRLRAVDAAL
jgi:hydroxypyruvate isomerase